MFIMSALRFIMVLLIALPIGYLLFLLAGDLADSYSKEMGNNRDKRKNTNGEKRSVHNSRRS